MTTAMDLADSFLADIVTSIGADNLPEKQWTQVGAPVIPCASVVVAILGLAPFVDPLAPPHAEQVCPPGQIATVSATITRDYVCMDPLTGDQDPADIQATSVVGQADADSLWDVVYSREHYLGPSSVTIGWVIEGGLIMASCQFQTGVGLVG